jgi:hypothetical protein
MVSIQPLENKSYAMHPKNFNIEELLDWIGRYNRTTGRKLEKRAIIIRRNLLNEVQTAYCNDRRSFINDFN